MNSDGGKEVSALKRVSIFGPFAVFGVVVAVLLVPSEQDLQREFIELLNLT